MTRRLFMALRVLFVVAGVTVIVCVVRWTDAVVVPAGAIGPEGNTTPHERTLDVQHMQHVPGEGWTGTLASGAPFTVEDHWARPGLLTVLADIDWWWLLVGLALVGCVYPIQTTRWWMLMRCRGLDAPWPGTLRLVMVGAFCNFFLPGTEGGDVVKAWGAARNSDRRLDSVMSVVFDRITGLVGLVVLAAVMGVVADPGEDAAGVTRWAGIAAASIAVVAVVTFALAMRGWLRLPTVARTFGGGLPGRLFDAGQAYARHPLSVTGATALSVGVQMLLASAAACCAWAVGATHDLTLLLVIMPVLFLAAAVPLTWQGAGVMEVLGIALLAVDGVASVNQVVALLVLYRGLELTWGLSGALLLLGGGIRLHPPEDAHVPSPR